MSEKGRKIFITGATGFIGRCIVSEGIKQGYSFTCLVRDPLKAKSLLPFEQCSFIGGDITKKETLWNAIRGEKTVINLVGIIAERKNVTFENIHYKGAKNIIDAAKSSGVEKFIQMSALGVRENGKTRYQITKWKAEEYLRNTGLKYTIFRPSVVFGREDKFINLFVKILKFSPFFPAIGKGTLEPVWAGDVARCFIESIDNGASDGKTIELGGGKVYSQAELLNTICAKMKFKRLIFPMPRLAAGIAALLSEFTMPAPLLTREQLIMLDEKNQVSGETPANIFSFSFKTLEDYLDEL